MTAIFDEQDEYVEYKLIGKMEAPEDGIIDVELGPYPFKGHLKMMAEDMNMVNYNLETISSREIGISR